MQTTPAIITRIVPILQTPTDVGAARSPGHSIRDQQLETTHLWAGRSGQTEADHRAAPGRDGRVQYPGYVSPCRLRITDLLATGRGRLPERSDHRGRARAHPTGGTTTPGKTGAERAVGEDRPRQQHEPLRAEATRTGTVATGGGERSVTPGVNVASPISNQREVTSTANTAAAVVPPTNGQQQQQIKSEQRIEGQIASCEISARVLDVDFDAADHRQRMHTGDAARFLRPCAIASRGAPRRERFSSDANRG